MDSNEPLIIYSQGVIKVVFFTNRKAQIISEPTSIISFIVKRADIPGSAGPQGPQGEQGEKGDTADLNTPVAFDGGSF